MRITIPVSGDGDAWMANLPEFDLDPSELIDESGKLVIPKVVDLFEKSNRVSEANCGRRLFTISSDDGFNVYSMTLEFMRQLAAVTHWIEGRPGAKAHVSADGSLQDTRLERRMARDQVAFCRIDVCNCATGVKFVVGSGNPKGKVIGNCENGARELAVYVTRIILNMAVEVNKMSIEKNAGLRVSVVGRDPELIADAIRREEEGQERDKRRDANELRRTCSKRQGEFCSPALPSCLCYRDGRCVELEV